MSKNDQDSTVTLEERLVAQFGELLEFSKLVSLLKYKSPLTLKRAVAAKQLEIQFSRVGTRKVVATRDVAKVLIKAGINPQPGSSETPQSD